MNLMNSDLNGSSFADFEAIAKMIAREVGALSSKSYFVQETQERPILFSLESAGVLGKVVDDNARWAQAQFAAPPLNTTWVAMAFVLAEGNPDEVDRVFHVYDYCACPGGKGAWRLSVNNSALPYALLHMIPEENVAFYSWKIPGQFHDTFIRPKEEAIAQNLEQLMIADTEPTPFVNFGVNLGGSQFEHN